MYYCTDCKNKFEFVEIVFETHGLSTPPFERIKRCPICHSTDYEEVKNTHCKFCGSKLRVSGEYCSDRCAKAGRYYFELEKRNREKFKNSAIASTVREIAEYNRLHGTKYSYGEYISLKDGGKI